MRYGCYTTKIMAMKKFNKFIRNNKAVTAIEFAILAPVFFLIFMGIIEVGLTMFVDSTLNTALRSAARKGIPTGYTNAQNFRNVMDDYMAGIYRDGPDMVITVRSITPPKNDSTNHISLTDSERELKELEDISTQLSTNPSVFFGIKDNFAPSIDQQSGAITVYAAKYKWGGFTKLVGAFLPDNLYAVSIVRNEVFDGSTPPVTPPSTPTPTPSG